MKAVKNILGILVVTTTLTTSAFASSFVSAEDLHVVDQSGLTISSLMASVAADKSNCPAAIRQVGELVELNQILAGEVLTNSSEEIINQVPELKAVIDIGAGYKAIETACNS